MRIVWPTSISSGSGFLVGWVSDDFVTIVTLLQGVDHNAAQQLVDALPNQTQLIRCGGLPRIVGVLNFASAPHDLLSFTLEHGRPVLQSAHADVIIYRPPNPRRLEFLALRPLDLGLPLPKTRNEQLEKLSANVARGIELDWLGPAQTGHTHVADLSLIIAQINCAHEVARALHRQQQASSRRLDPLIARLQSVLRLLAFALIPLHVASSTLLRIWSAPLPFLLGASIKDVSASIQQIDVRLEQALSTPSQFRRINEFKQTDLSVSRSQYIAVYNMLWLVANDIIAGSAVSAILAENADALAQLISKALNIYGVEHVQTAVRWLTEWPLGLKLNDELGGFFRDALLWLTAFWSETFILPLCERLPLVITLVGAASWLGTTMTLSLISDLLALSTVHLYVFNLLMTLLYDWHLRVLYSLYNVFRGRKYNMLRGRLEPHTYSVDQLLVGTVLFTLATFLFPTVLTFHLFCASTRLLIIAMHAGLETCLAFINHFPLFAVLLRLKEPGRLPGGLRFEISAGMLVLKNKPVSMGDIFGRHDALSRRLLAHYSPIELCKKVLTGRVLRPIERWQLRYSTA